MLVSLCSIVKRNISRGTIAVLKKYTKQMNVAQCDEILNREQQKALTSNGDTLELYHLYNIKTCVDFQFRRYGAIEMSLANQLNIMQQVVAQSEQTQQHFTPQNKDQFRGTIRTMVSQIYCKAMLVWLLSDHAKLRQYLQHNKASFYSDFKMGDQIVRGQGIAYHYIKAISNACIGNFESSIRDFIQIVNSKSSSHQEKQLSFLCLIVLKDLDTQRRIQNSPPSKQVDCQNNSRLLLKKIIAKLGSSDSTLKCKQHDFEYLDLEYCLNTYLSHINKAPVQYSDLKDIHQRFLPLLYFIGQKEYLAGNRHKAMDVLRYIPSQANNTYRNLVTFLELTELYDSKRYHLLISKIEPPHDYEGVKPQFSTLYPQWDKLVHDKYLLLQKTYQKHLSLLKQSATPNNQLQNQQSKLQSGANIQDKNVLQDKIEEIAEVIKIFQYINGVQIQGRVPWYYFPVAFEQFFTFPDQQLESKQKRGRRRKSGGQS